MTVGEKFLDGTLIDGTGHHIHVCIAGKSAANDIGGGGP